MAGDYYISMFHHKHGVSASVIQGDAAAYWAKADGYDPSDQEEYLTDATLPPLFSAAPNLLAALKMAKDELIDLYEEAYSADETDNDITEAIDAAIAAIAKAEGMGK